MFRDFRDEIPVHMTMSPIRPQAYCRGTKGLGWKVRDSFGSGERRTIPIAPRRLEKRVRFFTTRFAWHRPRWQFIIWQRQLAIVRQTFDVNTFSFMSLATAALPELEATGGAIVVVSSMAGKMGLPAVAAYSSSKHALHGFFDSLRHDLVNSRSNVSITTAILGSIDTESAKKGTTLPDGSPALPNVVWSPADECAAAIARHYTKSGQQSGQHLAEAGNE